MRKPSTSESKIVSEAKLNTIDMQKVITIIFIIQPQFTFDFVFFLAKLFNVQDTVNKQYIKGKMASLYGSNLSLEHGIEAALATAINCGFIKREKPGLFSKVKPCQRTSFAKEAWIATFFELNGRKLLPINELMYEPVLMYLDNIDLDWENTQILETIEDYTKQTIINKLK